MTATPRQCKLRDAGAVGDVVLAVMLVHALLLFACGRSIHQLNG
jgi:hypothetical protein